MIITWFPCPSFSQTQIQSCIFKFLRRSVDGKYLMRFQSETFSLKFLRSPMDGALSNFKWGESTQAENSWISFLAERILKQWKFGKNLRLTNVVLIVKCGWFPTLQISLELILNFPEFISLIAYCLNDAKSYFTRRGNFFGGVWYQVLRFMTLLQIVLFSFTFAVFNEQ